MRTILRTLPLALLALGLASAASALEVGKPAPPFELLGSDGATYTLEQYAGKREVVLAWFPKAFTPG